MVQMARLKVGDEAPDFTLPSQEGIYVTMSQFRGERNVVLYFYPKDGSPGCTAQACHFRDSHEVFMGLGAEVLGVSSDSVESHRKFAETHLLPFKLLSDEGGKVRRLYGATGSLGMASRVTFIIDREGVVRHVFSSQLRVNKHIDEALEVLKKLQ
jgi:peroxiredoxin Q/BCP